MFSGDKAESSSDAPVIPSFLQKAGDKLPALMDWEDNKQDIRGQMPWSKAN